MKSAKSVYALSIAVIVALVMLGFKTGTLKASEPLPVGEGGTGATEFSPGYLIGMGDTSFQTASGLYWDSVNSRLGVGTSTPSVAFELGTNKLMKLSTDVSTYSSEGLIQLRALTNSAKPYIAYQDASGADVVWLQAHLCLDDACTNIHKHFSIEASDAAGFKQTRFSVSYGADNGVVGVNQSDFSINRNTGMTNGNVILTGGGGGGVFKHANSFSFYPEYAVNGTYALQMALNGASNNELTLNVLGSSDLFFSDSLNVTGKIGTGANATSTAQLYVKSASGTAPIKIAPSALSATPQDGTFEYNGTHLYFTIGSTRHQLD